MKALVCAVAFMAVAHASAAQFTSTYTHNVTLLPATIRRGFVSAAFDANAFADPRTLAGLKQLATAGALGSHIR